MQERLDPRLDGYQDLELHVVRQREHRWRQINPPLDKLLQVQELLNMVRTASPLQDRAELGLHLIQRLLANDLHLLRDDVHPVPRNLPERHATGGTRDDPSTDGVRVVNAVTHHHHLLVLASSHPHRRYRRHRHRRTAAAALGCAAGLPGPRLPGAGALGGGVVAPVGV